ncbi:MAG: quinol oxidase subunit 2 [Paenibacillaceae bacterium]|nr:quinol oxidase subunit 2 [Paenibacillaceae bacterium]
MRMKRLLALLTAGAGTALLSGCEKLVVLNPQGPVARSIAELINWSMMWMLLVVVVVISLFVFIVWKYREKPENEGYEPPEDGGSLALEITWVVIPILIVIALTIPTVKALYKLEDIPAGYEDQAPLVIHVTSADWKWIFSYPEQEIETVNYVNIPAGRAVDFRLTSAGTMQSFWIPALAGQKYAMAKMENQLFVVADNPGSYLGRNTNFNGRGYADMEFEVLSQSPKDFEEWISEVKSTAPKLSEPEYEKLLEPTHLGRQTYSNTHLEWVDHADPDSKSYTNPEMYRIDHGYPGKTFTEPDQYNAPNSGQTQDNTKKDGGEKHGH